MPSSTDTAPADVADVDDLDWGPELDDPGYLEWVMAPMAPSPSPIPPPPAWHTEAACLGEDPALWFPELGQTPARGLEICEGCPVRIECGEWAIAEGFEYGTFGGMTDKARRPQLEQTFTPPTKLRPRPAPQDQLCADGCGRLVPAGKGATHPTCRQREARRRRRAA